MEEKLYVISYTDQNNSKIFPFGNSTFTLQNSIFEIDKICSQNINFENFQLIQTNFVESKNNNPEIENAARFALEFAKILEKLN
ncbi:hypothetical protein LEP1GSC132_2499 [Leptospira kirschneri str. 200803703]|nr:hypothetical protein LEP1GSC132_2499 [Leptospira kirschneri str. 200803703]